MTGPPLPLISMLKCFWLPKYDAPVMLTTKGVQSGLRWQTQKTFNTETKGKGNPVRLVSTLKQSEKRIQSGMRIIINTEIRAKMFPYRMAWSIPFFGPGCPFATTTHMVRFKMSTYLQHELLALTRLAGRKSDIAARNAAFNRESTSIQSQGGNMGRNGEKRMEGRGDKGG